ncbi:MAG: PilZ domain-containing protein [Terriglobia bacterium]
MGDAERRGNPRIHFRVDYPEMQPRVRDISISGAYIDDPRPLSRGRMLRMRIWLSDEVSITVGAMVRRVDEGAGMGVEFVEISDADRTRLRGIITVMTKAGRVEFF